MKHASRRLRPWLIFDVGQAKRSVNTRIFIVLLGWMVAGICDAAQSNRDNGIECKAYYAWLQHDEMVGESFYGHGNQKLLIYVVFKNVSESTITIPATFKTFGSGSGKSHDGKRTLRIAGGVFKLSTASGEWNIPSLIELLPVELKEGEATQVKILAKVTERPEDVDQVTVGYNVDKRVAERFGMWSGRLHVVAREIKDWAIPK